MQSLKDIWQLVLSEMKSEFSKTQISLWFEDLELLSLTDSSAVLLTTSDFKYNILSTKYQKTVEAYLEKVLGFHVSAIFESPERQNTGNTAGQTKYPADILYRPEDDHPPLHLHAEAGTEKENKGEPEPPILNASSVSSLSSDQTGSESPTNKNEYTFENFIVGNSNRFAHAACLAVASAPARDYNPLFIYGSSGLGKTHLLYAIINEVKRRTPSTNIVYVKGEDFTNEMIDSISKNYSAQFRDRYRKADMLLIDDIQFIAGKESTQEEFFHTFNALYEDHKQIIMTSDLPPRDIKKLEERLRTRFEWGLIADVQVPDFELRIAIMKKKAEALRIDIPNEVLEFLAENLRNNVRQLEGAVKKLGAQSFLTGIPITTDLAISCVADMLTGSEPVRITVDRIIDRVSKKYNIPPEDIKGRKRTKEISRARHVTLYLIRKLTDMSLPAIGKLMGRDHTTVLSSLDTVENELKTNLLFEIEINDLIKNIKENPN